MHLGEGIGSVQTIREVLLVVIGIYSLYLLITSFKGKDWVDLSLAIIIIVMLVMTRFIGIIYISGPSMQPTFQTGDFILVRRTQEIARYDIVVVDWQNRRLIKRAIGLGDEEISLVDGFTFIDGNQLTEPFEYITNHTTLSPIRIPHTDFFIMGDNRANSYDSRMLGPIPQEAIYGKMVAKIPLLAKIPFVSQILEYLLK